MIKLDPYTERPKVKNPQSGLESILLAIEKIHPHESGLSQAVDHEELFEEYMARGEILEAIEHRKVFKQPTVEEREKIMRRELEEDNHWREDVFQVISGGILFTATLMILVVILSAFR